MRDPEYLKDVHGSPTSPEEAVRRAFRDKREGKRKTAVPKPAASFRERQTDATLLAQILPAFRPPDSNPMFMAGAFFFVLGALAFGGIPLLIKNVTTGGVLVTAIVGIVFVVCDVALVRIASKRRNQYEAYYLQAQSIANELLHTANTSRTPHLEAALEQLVTHLHSLEQPQTSWFVWVSWGD